MPRQGGGIETLVNDGGTTYYCRMGKVQWMCERCGTTPTPVQPEDCCPHLLAAGTVFLKGHGHRLWDKVPG